MASKKLIAVRYADAMFAVALEAKALDVVEKDFDTLMDIMEANGEYKMFLTSKVIPGKMQEVFLNTVVKAIKLNKVTEGVLRVLLKNNRLFVLSELVEIFKHKVKEHKGIVTAEVTTAVKLDKASNDDIAKDLESVLGKKVDLKSEVNKEILGGMVVKVGSQMLDASLSSKLSQLEQRMRSVKI